MTVTIHDYWACLAPTERAACQLMATPSFVPPAFVLAVLVDAVFAVNGTIDPELRREVWEGSYGMTRVEFEVEGESVDVYFANQQWCLDLWYAQDEGELLFDDPLCLQLAFYNLPTGT